MPSLNHVHIYVRFSKTQYKCDDPHCTHIQTKDRLLGKAARCSKCKSVEFILTREDLKRAKPVCINCSNTKAAINFRENRKIMETVLSDNVLANLINNPKDEE